MGGGGHKCHAHFVNVGGGKFGTCPLGIFSPCPHRQGLGAAGDRGCSPGSRHSVLWEPRAAERVSQPEPKEAAPGDEGVLPQPRAPSPSPQPPEEASRQPAGPGLSGAPQRPRISLCAVMRSISLMESPQPPELLGEPLDGAVSAGAGGTGGGQGMG